MVTVDQNDGGFQMDGTLLWKTEHIKFLGGMWGLEKIHGWMTFPLPTLSCGSNKNPLILYMRKVRFKVLK